MAPQQPQIQTRVEPVRVAPQPGPVAAPIAVPQPVQRQQAPLQVQPPLQPRPDPSSPTPGWRERAADRAEQRGAPDVIRGHRSERPTAPQPPQIQTRVDPVRVAPAPVAAPVAVPQPVRIENRAPAESRQRQRDGKDDDHGRRPERGDPRNQLQ